MPDAPQSFVVAIPVYRGVDLMDVAAPREMFSWVGDRVRIELVADTLDPVHTRDGMQIVPTKTFDDPSVSKLDLIWVPGGSQEGLEALLGDPEAPFWSYVANIGGAATWVCSVCEGAVLLANTGLLDGYRATTHWAFYPCMLAFPEVELVEPEKRDGQWIYPRYVRDRNRVTGGGISSGLDEALFLIETIFGTAIAESVQQTTQYYPEPPLEAPLTPATCCNMPRWAQNPEPC